MTFTMALALGAALAGWLGGLGGDFSEFAWDTTELFGIVAALLLLPAAASANRFARQDHAPQASQRRSAAG